MTKYGPSALAKYGNEHEEMQDIARENIVDWHTFPYLRDFIRTNGLPEVSPGCIDELNVLINSEPYCGYPEARKRKLRRVRAYIKRVLKKREATW